VHARQAFYHQATLLDFDFFWTGFHYVAQAGFELTM
jgi:hypothetical protein